MEEGKGEQTYHETLSPHIALNFYNKFAIIPRWKASPTSGCFPRVDMIALVTRL